MWDPMAKGNIIKTFKNEIDIKDGGFIFRSVVS